MIFLLLSMLCSVSVAHVFRYVQEKSLPMFGLFAVNYFVASCVALWGCDRTFWQQWPAVLLVLGVIIGILFVCSYVLMVLSIRRLGVTIPISLMRLSAVLPTFGSILFFAEVLNALQCSGIVLAFLALPLASQDRCFARICSKYFTMDLDGAYYCLVCLASPILSLKFSMKSCRYVILIIFLPCSFRLLFSCPALCSYDTKPLPLKPAWSRVPI